MKKDDVLDQKAVHRFCDPVVGRDAVLAFANSHLFYDDEHRYEMNFFGRRIRPHVLKFLDFTTPAPIEELGNYAAFAANRVLFAMNETDFLLLPTTTPFYPDDFDEFYCNERRASAAVGVPFLENYLFGFLSNEIQVSDSWSLKQVKNYFTDFLESSRKIKTLDSAQAILDSRDPKNIAKDWLVQLAPDFLIESSPMARYASENYGEIGANLFKIIIDELGYGEFEKKHSTLYQRTLMSVGLNDTPHYYWQYYLNSSLLLANYYHMITRNKRHIFRYIGAIYLAETGFMTSCRIWRDALVSALPEIDVRYFNEHCHIDIDHSRMALEGLVVPAIERYGPLAAREIVQGFEEARWLGEFAERDFSAQARWKDEAEDNKALHDKIISKVKSTRGIECAQFVEPKGELSVTHSHDEDELCHVVSGEMEFLNGFEKSTILGPGEGIIIKKNRLHGALISSEECIYEIHNIKDASAWT